MTFVVIRALLVLPEIKGSQFSQFVWSMNAKARTWQVSLGIIRHFICYPLRVLKCRFDALFLVREEKKKRKACQAVETVFLVYISGSRLAFGMNEDNT